MAVLTYALDKLIKVIIALHKATSLVRVQIDSVWTTVQPCGGNW